MRKRPNGEGTIFFDKKDKRYRAQFYDSEGKRRTLSATSREDIHKKLREAISSRDKGSLLKQSVKNETLGHNLEKWYEIQSKSNWSFKTSENVRLEINRYIKPLIGSKKLNQIDSETIQETYIKIKEQHKLSDASIHRIHRLYRKFFKYALKNQKIFKNPMEGVEAPRVRKPKMNVLETTDIFRILKSTKSMQTEWQVIWRICILTGLRQGEVLGFFWDAFNAEDKSIEVSQQLQRQTGNGLVIKELKTDIAKRKLFLDSTTVNLLKKWRLEQTQLKLASKCWGDIDLIFTNSLGKPIEPRLMAKKWASLLRLNGINHIKLHGARHSFATMMIKNGVDINTVRHYLGHTDIKTTLSIYDHITESSLNTAAEKISYLESRGA